jgi:hypothetical protein
MFSNDKILFSVVLTKEVTAILLRRNKFFFMFIHKEPKMRQFPFSRSRSHKNMLMKLSNIENMYNDKI